MVLDPLNAHAIAIHAQTLFGAKRPDVALEALLRSKELDPMLWHPRGLLVIPYIRQVEAERAVAEAEAAAEVLGRNPFTLQMFAAALAADGRMAEAERVYEELIDLSRQQYVSPSFIAYASEALGKTDIAFRWLDKALRERDLALILYLSSVWWPSEFFNDPRFGELQRRAGLR